MAVRGSVLRPLNASLDVGLVGTVGNYYSVHLIITFVFIQRKKKKKGNTSHSESFVSSSHLL